MKQADLAVGMVCAVETGHSPRRLVKATVLEKGVRYRKASSGVRVRWDADGGSRYSMVQRGDIEVVPSFRIKHVWSSDDDVREAQAAANRGRVGIIEARLRDLGIIPSREHLELEHAADQEARIAARKRGDEDWYSAEGEPVGRPHASVGIANVTMPLETLEFLLERTVTDAG